MYEIIMSALEEVGICADIDLDALSKDQYDVNLQEYVTDSITFITFIIKIEEKLGIELPDDILLYDRIASIKSLAINLKEISTMNKLIYGSH